MTHASWNNERGGPSGPGHDNERLEYLGDAVLELVVGEYLFRRFPDYDEGQLTQLRAALVNTISLARLAAKLEIGDALLVGKGAAKTGANRLPSLLANAFEAMIGAIFLDQGYRVATRVFIHNIGDLADWTDENHKGRLQEVAQERTGSPPSYRVSAVAATGNRRQYRAEALVGGEVLGSGVAATKQAAEQAAAREALKRLSGGRGRGGPRTPTARAAGAAQKAAAQASGESLRARRRIAEAAADVSAGPSGSRRRRRNVAAGIEANPPALEVPVAPAASPSRRRGLLGALARAAEALVGRNPSGVEEPPSAPAARSAAPGPPAARPPSAGPAAGAAAAAQASESGRARRGRRGGRGRRRPSTAAAPPVAVGAAAPPAKRPAGTGSRPRRGRPDGGSAGS